MKPPPSSKGKKTVKAWALISPITHKFYTACAAKAPLEARADLYDIIVPCTITYQLPKDDK